MRVEYSMFIDNPKTDEIYSWLQRELRTDHAGETGAIAIYDGILAMSSCKKVRGFATRHRETEKQHLQRIESLLPASQRSFLLPVWRIAGFFTGAIPALISSSMVFATIAAVESFVDSHYSQQINRLSDKPLYSDISDILQECRQDELEHRDEAIKLQVLEPGVFVRGWCWLVGFGSVISVSLARRV